MLVLDASAVLEAAQFGRGFAAFGSQDLVAPPLMWSEARSSLHERLWRGELSEAFANGMLRGIEEAPIAVRTHPMLGAEAWRIADSMGWARTYDAEYVALASLLECRLVTTDRRLRRGTERLGFVVHPDEL